MDRFRRLMPRSSNIEFLLLKGHLLLEEQLRHFIDGCMHNPEFLIDARLTFYQLVRLTEAIVGGNEIWSTLEKLNALRNKLAHNAEPPDLDKDVDFFLAIWAERGFTRHTTTRGRVAHLRKALTTLCAMVSGFTEGYLSVLHDPPRNLKHTIFSPFI